MKRTLSELGRDRRDAEADNLLRATLKTQEKKDKAAANRERAQATIDGNRKKFLRLWDARGLVSAAGCEFTPLPAAGTPALQHPPPP